MPRSATTFLFRTLLEDRSNFHGFKLWETVFAPSIIQKYLILFIINIDKRIGFPLYKISLKIDKILFNRTKNIHDIHFSMEEEEEGLFLLNFSSVIFYYFFPGIDFLNNILYQDNNLPDKLMARHIRFYYRCVQRHLFVFDRRNSRYFLSKNPAFLSRIESLEKQLPHAKFIYPLRSPYETIPSFISLNSIIFDVFCSLPELYPLKEECRDLMINWYIHADNFLRRIPKSRKLVIDYKQISNDSIKCFKAIYNMLGIAQYSSLSRFSRKSHNSVHKYNNKLGIDKFIINNKLKNVLSEEYLN